MRPVEMSEMLAQLRAMDLRAQGSEAPGGGDAKVDFAALLKQSIDAVNDTQHQAGQLANRFEKGDGEVELAEVMVALQKARISFQALTQVRNRLVDAYNDIKNMSI